MLITKATSGNTDESDREIKRQGDCVTERREEQGTRRTKKRHERTIGKPAETFEVHLHSYVRGLSGEEAIRGSGGSLTLSPTLATPIETPPPSPWSASFCLVGFCRLILRWAVAHGAQ